MTKRAKAVYDFEGSDEGELPFVAGDVLEILQEDDSGWWMAQLNGKTGLIPHNYVEVFAEGMEDVDLLSGGGSAVAASSSAGAGQQAVAAGDAEGDVIDRQEERENYELTGRGKQVQTRVVGALGSAHRGLLKVGDSVQRFDDKHNISGRIAEFDRNHRVTERAERAAARVDRWSEDNQVAEKAIAAEERMKERVREFGDNHPKVKAAFDAVTSTADKALTRMAEFFSKVGDKVVKSKVGKAIAKQGSRVQHVIEQTANQTEDTLAQQERDHHAPIDHTGKPVLQTTTSTAVIPTRAVAPGAGQPVLHNVRSTASASASDDIVMPNAPSS